jgi:hypothetical protein
VGWRPTTRWPSSEDRQLRRSFPTADAQVHGRLDRDIRADPGRVPPGAAGVVGGHSRYDDQSLAEPAAYDDPEHHCPDDHVGADATHHHVAADATHHHVGADATHHHVAADDCPYDQPTSDDEPASHHESASVHALTSAQAAEIPLPTLSVICGMVCVQRVLGSGSQGNTSE